MRIRDLMTTDPACCTPDSNLQEVARLMVEHDCGSIPVCEGRRVVGVITDRDIATRVVAAGREPQSCSAKDVMSHPVATITVDSSMEDCLNEMEQNQLRRIPVVDNQGDIVGVVAQADIARAAPRDATAELVQEISEPNSGGARLI